MSLSTLASRDEGTSRVVAPVLDVVVPVHNEETDLAPSVRRLHTFLSQDFPFEAVITIADNASTDGTWACATALAAELDGVRAVHLDEKGRGRALNHVWGSSEARVVAYMDVDLSTDLAALLPLVAPLLTGHSDVAIGSRLSRSSRVVRGPKREFISRTYNLILRTVMATRVRDAQCGFKAVRSDVARRLVPAVQDDGWFFDTELLLLAERNGLRIHEVPVTWVDDPDSRVHIANTAWNDLKGTARMFRTTTLEFQKRTADPALAPQRDLPDILALGGGVPIQIGNETIGGVGSSGSSQEMDEACAKAGIAKVADLLK